MIIGPDFPIDGELPEGSLPPELSPAPQPPVASEMFILPDLPGRDETLPTLPSPQQQEQARLDALGVEHSGLSHEALCDMDIEELRKSNHDPCTPEEILQTSELSAVLLKYGEACQKMPAGHNNERKRQWLTIKSSPEKRRTPFELAVTPEKLVRFLNVLSKTGVMYKSAEYAQCSSYVIKSMIDTVPEFKALVEEAKAKFSEVLHEEAVRRAVNGWDEPIIGGKERDTVVAYKKMYDSRLMELLLKRHDHQFRDKFEGSVSISGGVLVVPGVAQSVDEWEAMEKKKTPTIISADGSEILDKEKTNGESTK